LNSLDSSSEFRLDRVLRPDAPSGKGGAGPFAVPDVEENPLPVAATARAARTAALSPAIEAAVGALAPLSLQELKRYALLNRTDTKYLLTERQALEILDAVRPDYRALEVDGLRAGHYYTKYFDTPDLRMYLDHHNGHRDRYKVRVRTYLDSGVCFLEVKRKNNHERTSKQRLPVTVGSGLVGASADFVRAHTPYDSDALIESVTTEFLRVTLGGVNALERLTIDFGFCFQWRGLRGRLPGLVIVEVKQPRYSTQSSFMQQLIARHVESSSFSKYCVGLVVLDPTLRYNQFKPLLFHLRRLLHDYQQPGDAGVISGPLATHQVEGAGGAPPATGAHAPNPLPVGVEAR
jgi:hypothetical protein